MMEIGRDCFESPVYACEISTLEELMDLAEKSDYPDHGHGWSKTILVSPIKPISRGFDPGEGFAGCITIYDDYLE